MMSLRRLPTLVTCHPPAMNVLRACSASPWIVELFNTTSGSLPLALDEVVAVDELGRRVGDFAGDGECVTVRVGVPAAVLPLDG